jgi:hypothetical protein
MTSERSKFSLHVFITSRRYFTTKLFKYFDLLDYPFMHNLWYKIASNCDLLVGKEIFVVGKRF